MRISDWSSDVCSSDLWDESTGETRSSADLMAEYRKLAETPGLVAREEGDAAAAIAGAAKVLEADYEFPYLAHAPMEPLDCVVQLGDDGCDIWAGSQIPTSSEEHTSELQSLMRISYAVFCL